MVGTPFSVVYNLFLSQIKSYELAELDEEMLEKNLQLWLLGSIPYFQNCKKNLNLHDASLGEFAEELNLTEGTILAKYMVSSYVSTFLITEENLSQALNSKDYRMYSPANQLKALESLRTGILQEVNTLKSQYSWNVHSIREMYER